MQACWVEIEAPMIRNVYEFTCPNCEAAGEAGVPANMRSLIAHGCGQLFKQHPAHGMHSKPKLVAVNNANGGNLEWQARTESA